MPALSDVLTDRGRRQTQDPSSLCSKERRKTHKCHKFLWSQDPAEVALRGTRLSPHKLAILSRHGDGMYAKDPKTHTQLCRAHTVQSRYICLSGTQTGGPTM